MINSTDRTPRTPKFTKNSVKLCVALCALYLKSFSQTQDWDFYYTNIEEKPASIGLNLALRDTAPIADKPHCYWISITFQQTDSIGFPLKNENEMLNKMEDELEDYLQKKTASIYTGRITLPGKRQFYFYAKTLDSIDIYIGNILKKYPLFKYKLGEETDEKWTIYLDFLFPSPLDLQLIYNHRTIELLAENGDNSSVSRHIDHFVNFKTKKDLNAFAKALKGSKFIAEKIFDADNNNMYPLGLQVSEENKTDAESIDESVIQLFRLAEKFKGAYDGWETYPVKE